MIPEFPVRTGYSGGVRKIWDNYRRKEVWTEQDPR